MRSMPYPLSPSRAQVRNKVAPLREISEERIDLHSSPASLKRTSRIFDRIARVCLGYFLFLVPIFFLPFTSDFIEFNKQYLLYGFVTVALLAWVAQGFVDRGFRIPRTPLALPLLGLLGVVLISSIFSKDRTASFFGEYERLTFGVIPFVWYLLLFYLLVHYIHTAAQVRRAFFLLVAGATVAMLYFWAAVIGFSKIPMLAPFVPLWNTISGVNSRFIVALIVPMLVAFTFLLEMRISHTKKVWWGIVAAISFLTILAFGFKGVFLIGAVGLAVWLAMVFTRLQGIRIPIISLVMVTFFVFVVVAIFGTGGLLRVANFPIEVSLSHRTSWNIAIDTLKEGVGRALVGSGPATFGYDFSAHRSEQFNRNIFWESRFNTASSEIAGLTATIGVIGMVFLAFLVIVVFWIFKTMSVRVQEEGVEARSLFGATLGIWCVLVVALFFVPFGTVGWVYFFVLLALFIAQGRMYMKEGASEMLISFEKSASTSLASSFGGIALLTVLLVCIVYLGRFYAGEVYFRRGLQAIGQRDAERATISFVRAASINKEQLRYALALTQAQFQQAVAESQKDKPDIARAGRFISGAVTSARGATQRAPHSAGAWEQLGGLYGQVVGLAPEARGWAIEAYGRAIELEPTSPTLLVLRGQQFLGDKKFQEAQRDFERAVELKPDYAVAHLALSLLFEQQKDFDKAISEATEAVKFGGNDLNMAYQLARLYFNRAQGEDGARAEKILSAIITRNPNYANAHFTLGSLYERQGKTSEAIREFEKVRELNPKNSEIEQKLEGLVVSPSNE